MEYNDRYLIEIEDEYDDTEWDNKILALQELAKELHIPLTIIY